MTNKEGVSYVRITGEAIIYKEGIGFDRGDGGTVFRQPIIVKT